MFLPWAEHSHSVICLVLNEMIPSSSAAWTSSDALSPLSALSATERGQQLGGPLHKKLQRCIIWHLSLRNTVTLFSIRATVSHLWTTRTSLRSVDLGHQWRSHWFRTVPKLGPLLVFPNHLVVTEKVSAHHLLERAHLMPNLSHAAARRKR